MVLEKSLHAGNIAVAFGVVADVAFCGGITTAIGAALSAHDLFRKSEEPTKVMAVAIAKASETALSDTGLSGDVKLHVLQMLGAFPPSETDLTKGNLVAEKIATRMRARVKIEAKDPSHKGSGELIGYERILTDILAAVLAQIDPMQLAIWRELLERTETSGNAARLADEGITEKAIIRLAQRIAGETNDVGQAWSDLQSAMDKAVEVQQDGRVTSNHEGFVDEVLKRVRALTADGDYKAALSEIEEALEVADAQTLRLLGSAANVAILDGDTSKAASLLIRAADVEAGGQSEFAALRALWDHYYVIGRDKGLNSEAQMAVDLAELVVLRASTPDERGTALNDLGNALQTLGERESGTARLEQAVIACKAALEERTQDRVPLQWATTRNNLGTALQTLGARDSGTARLEQAVTAYEAALEERTQDRMPLDWAMTQNNLGAALQALGERESGTARLEQAVTAFEAALEEWTQDRVPLQWAITQSNLTNVEIAFFDKDGETAHLDRAADHSDKARAVFLDGGASQYAAVIDRIAALIEARRGSA